jgi:predicted nucleotidyltransferase
MLNPDYKDMLRCLQRRNAKFLVVGAYAIAAHGFPRSTMDIDFWVKPELENAQAVYEAIRDFGAPLMDLTSESLSYPSVVFQIGVAPIRIDILTAISGDIDFDDAYQTALQLELDGVKLRVPSIDVLIKNKESTGREKDLLDVKALKKQCRERRL